MYIVRHFEGSISLIAITPIPILEYRYTLSMSTTSRVSSTTPNLDRDQLAKDVRKASLDVTTYWSISDAALSAIIAAVIETAGNLSNPTSGSGQLDIGYGIWDIPGRQRFYALCFTRPETGKEGTHIGNKVVHDDGTIVDGIYQDNGNYTGFRGGLTRRVNLMYTEGESQFIAPMVKWA
jgi:hypothetical protein